MPTFQTITQDAIDKAHANGDKIYIIINGDIYDFCTNETEGE